MAGHSKWANIKHRKDSVDRKRGLLFSKLAREIMVAARLGGTDVASNNRLRIAITKARGANMPKDNIERAVKKGAGELEGQNFEEVMYEVFASGGVGIIVEAVTDKKSRTTPEIKNIINKNNANLAEANAVSRLFQHCGYVQIPENAVAEEALMEVAIEAGAEDVRSGDGIYEIISPPEDFAAISEAINDREIAVNESGIRFLPLDGTEVVIDDAEEARKIMKLIDILDEHDDVQSVYSNLEVSDRVLAELEQDD
ncbi:MAG: YebC/PmpR family DNA-binding transcriptional regulator [Leptospiraceae bacterium]|nr:YebC/PmpR family DNA-binding transcriptional regulator [Leptospiraceae bacterium]